MTNRAGDWKRQAERDMEQAEDSRTAGRHEWACFAAHQAAEKAVKAWGHVVATLLAELPARVAAPAMLVEQAKVLDNFYVSARDPNGHPEGAPFEHYGPLQSEEAIRYAREVLGHCRPRLA